MKTNNTTTMERNNAGFGGYYGRLRVWQGVKSETLAWRELGEPEQAQDPDWWIDDTTTRAEYQERNRRHAAKFRDDWA
ncbi:TPA: hypothetical protein QHN36_003575 [Enterobacter bugandensis]|nr:hypothetical protein [Enterobacter bugandensis]